MALERRCELAAGFAQRVGLQVTFGGNGSYIYLHLPTRIHAFLWVQICIRSCVLNVWVSEMWLFVAGRRGPAKQAYRR